MNKIRKIASHYLCLEDGRFLRRQVVVLEDGIVRSYYALTGEMEDIEWMPGVIELHTDNSGIIAYLLYPYDFIEMKPVGGTQRRLLK